MSPLAIVRGTVGGVLGLVLWLGVKQVFDIPDRYLPGANAIMAALVDIGPAWLDHTAATVARTVIGSTFGLIAGVGLALILFKVRLLAWVMPLVHGLRAVPAVAITPFFLLWFGFSETGRYLLVVLGLGLNVMVACADRLERPTEADLLLFHNLQARRTNRLLNYWLPRVLEDLLPTLRFAVALALGLIVVSEMLGAQKGLGYLMQTARATFSLNVIFVAALVLGLIATIMDLLLRLMWSQLVTWKR